MVAALRPRVPANVTLVARRHPRVRHRRGSRRLAGPGRRQPSLQRLVADPVPACSRRTGAGGCLVDATLMLQREVAERIAAPLQGRRDYGVLSILIQLHADVRRLLTLPPGAFRPAPKVHSAVVALTFRPPAVALSDEALFEAMVRSMFTQRRKMLGERAVGRLPSDAAAARERRPRARRHRPAPPAGDAATRRTGAACGGFWFELTTGLCYSRARFQPSRAGCPSSRPGGLATGGACRRRVRSSRPSGSASCATCPST